MCKRNTPDKNEPSMGCVRKITRENPQIKKTEEVNPTWYVQETPQIKKRKRKKPARDV